MKFGWLIVNPREGGRDFTGRADDLESAEVLRAHHARKFSECSDSLVSLTFSEHTPPPSPDLPRHMRQPEMPTRHVETVFIGAQDVTALYRLPPLLASRFICPKPEHYPGDVLHG